MKISDLKETIYFSRMKYSLKEIDLKIYFRKIDSEIQRHKTPGFLSIAKKLKFDHGFSTGRSKDHGGTLDFEYKSPS